ncbi:LysR family transcriptional regulator [Peptoniphilus stercorisuis]|uniref:DNA-binding transcriptional LysR family regulator n=1 Tax=Peptoniphilus stercorisuis TaxID=1436965 RepID=A0ABS4KE96_9FIRM|nr:LysR family transcriptional regulator [Peptoniphilus stercorisuis]MBP2026096.1 DNA-binding transcriptional LysR family regulator [Peptoniphilus stercorisuis]
MIDYRLNTFLVLCEELNYTQTAKKLHITQPNVSQHIKYLEEYYNVELFKYKNRKLTMTKDAKKLNSLIIRLKSDSKKIEYIMEEKEEEKINLNFGATLTIGEYIMPEIIKNLDLNKYKISMRVENTEALLYKLENSIIDFAMIEGHFDKSKYDTFLFSKEKFIGIGSYENQKNYKLEDLLSHRLIIREKGSGTREVFEHILFDNNLSTGSFKDIVEIGNMNGIQKLVSENIGISFLYERATKEFMEKKLIRELNIENLNIYREFNFVILKNNKYKKRYFDIYNLIRNLYK